MSRWRRRRKLLVVTITPTYSGCPATSVIALDDRERAARQGIEQAPARAAHLAALDDRLDRGAGRRASCRTTASPRRSTKRRSRPVAAQPARAQDRDGRLPALRFSAHRAGQQFGSTPCKAQYRCRDCLEPFDYFKCI